MSVSRALELVAAERARQDEKWGVQNHTPLAWLGVAMEEMGEWAQATLQGHSHDARCEAVQVAAVAVAFLEWYDRTHQIMSDWPEIDGSARAGA